jgi:hypothetical protein
MPKSSASVKHLPPPWEWTKVRKSRPLTDPLLKCPKRIKGGKAQACSQLPSEVLTAPQDHSDPKVAKLLAALHKKARAIVERHHRLRKQANFDGAEVHPGMICGVSVGKKARANPKAGDDTGEPCLVFHVLKKSPLRDIPKENRINARSLGVLTDVVESGIPLAHVATNADPLQAGESFSHPSIGDGTAACLVTRPSAAPGSRDLFVLGANHVLAACNQAPLGQMLINPSPAKNGRSPDDDSAFLSDYIVLDWQNYNSVDAAIAGISPSVARKGFVIGGGFIPELQDPATTTDVYKVGAGSGFTEGTLTGQFYTGPIFYTQPVPRSALFSSLMIVEGKGNTAFSTGGDSGALVVDRNTNKPFGMIVAGHLNRSFVCPLADVLSILRVDLFG